MRCRATTDFSLRSGTEADGPMIADVFGAARAASMPFVPVLYSIEEERNFFSRQLAAHSSLIAMREKRCAAFVIFRNGWIDHLYVHPDWHRQGLGTALLDELKTRQPEGLQLWTFQANEGARAFYERNGFTCVEVTDGSGNEERLPDQRYRWVGSGDPTGAA